MTERAIVYARVSSDDRGKDGRNLASQLEMGREYAEEHGYQVVAELAEDDRGASGVEINLPELNRVRSIAQADEADVLIVREIDRLSRNLAKQLIVEEELQGEGVRIEYVIGEYPDTPEGRLNKHIKATIAEYDREKTIERLVRGTRNSVKAGNVIVYGKPPYGYRVDESDGKRTLVIFEKEARIVRLIYQWYTVGNEENGPMPMRAIFRRLSKSGIPDKEMPLSTIRHILCNETYAGVWHFGKRRRGRQNPDEHLIAVKVPAIVTRETWNAAKQKQEQNKDRSKRNTKYQYLLRRRVVCGDCGAKMNALHNRDYRYYRCQVRFNVGYTRECGQRVYFRADRVDATVWKWLEGVLSDPDRVAEDMRQEQAEQAEVNKPLKDRLAIIDDLLADYQTQFNRLLDLYLSGEFPKEILIERKGRLEKTIADLQRERANVAAQLKARILSDEQIETLVDRIRKVGKALQVARRDFETQRYFVDMLDVTARLAVEDGEKAVHPRCILGEGPRLIVSNTTNRAACP